MSRIIPLLALFLAACAGTPDTEVRHDPHIAIENMETFYIRPQPARPSSETVAAARREIERAIQDTLVAKGYRRVMQSRMADFEVDYVMYVSERYQQGGHDRYLLDDHVRLLSGTGSELADPVRVGNLHIHFFYDGKPFFEGIASGVIETGVAIDKRIRTAVQRVLRKVPDAQ